MFIDHGNFWRIVRSVLQRQKSKCVTYTSLVHSRYRYTSSVHGVSRIRSSRKSLTQLESETHVPRVFYVHVAQFYVLPGQVDIHRTFIPVEIYVRRIHENSAVYSLQRPSNISILTRSRLSR